MITSGATLSYLFFILSVQYLEHGLAILVHITPPTPGFEPGPWMSEGS
jgi:hypothetical protein